MKSDAVRRNLPAGVLEHVADHQLDGADELHTDDVVEWTMRMVELNRRHGVKILGGCCGTTDEHLESIVRESRSRGSVSERCGSWQVSQESGASPSSEPT